MKFHKRYTDIIEQAYIEGSCAMGDSFCLCTQEDIIEKQKDWPSEDEFKNFDFTKSKFWLHVFPDQFFKVDCLQDLIEIFEHESDVKQYFGE